MRLRGEKDRYDRAVAAINKKIDGIRALCKHEDETYFGDPAGGTDSFHECDICGKQRG